MIRWLLAILVLANVGFYMWGSWYKDGGQSANATQQASIDPLRMKLISDPAVKATLRGRGQRSTVKTLKAVKRICHSVGAFSSNRAAMRGGKRMKKAGMSYSLRTVEVKESRYQIYVPPLKSRKAAHAMQKRLSRLGFRDNALMPDRRLRNAISVGIFNVKANAAQRRKQLQKKGIRIRQRRITNKSRRFWLDVPIDEAKLVRLKSIKWRQKGVVVKQTTCVSASGKTRPK